jgi:hypothetical protein
MSGGGSDTQETTTTAEPYKASKPLLDKAMGDAMSAYNGGGLVPSSGMKTAIPYSGLTREGMGDIRRNARSAMGTDAMAGTLGQMGNIWGNGGYNSQQQTALDALNPIARGDYLNKPDANFEAVLSRTKENAGTDVNSMMSGMGRFAGGAHQGIFADTMGGIESQARLGQYNLERDRQAGAIGDLFNMGQQGQSNLSNSGSIYQSLLAGQDAPANSLMGLGAMQEDYKGRVKNDQLRMADSGLTNLQALLGIAGGAGGYGKTTAQMPMQNNGWSNALGMGMSAASMMSMLGGY